MSSLAATRWCFKSSSCECSILKGNKERRIIYRDRGRLILHMELHSCMILDHHRLYYMFTFASRHLQQELVLPILYSEVMSLGCLHHLAKIF